MTGTPDLSPFNRAALLAARAVVVLEALWPPVLWLLLLVAGFLALAFFGLFTRVPDVVRFALIGFFALAVLHALVRLALTPLPEREIAARRLERSSGLHHRPLSAIADRPANHDPVSHALFEAHRKREQARLQHLTPGLPDAGIARRDPFALRAPVLLIAFIAWFYAGDTRLERLYAVFSGPEVMREAAPRIDAWLAPPAHTGRQPSVLIEAAADPERFGETLSLPQGTLLVVRISEPGAVDLMVTGSEEADAPSGENRYILMRNGALTLHAGGAPLAAFAFTIEPDNPPVIALADEPTTEDQGALSLRALMEDDFGVQRATARFSLPAGTGDEALVEPPSAVLVLPANPRNGASQTLIDLSAHPLAGTDLVMTLVAEDAAGQEGMSSPAIQHLPERPWRDPLARALIEQRRTLALDRTAAGPVVQAMDALMLGAEHFMADDLGLFLAMRLTRTRLLHARDDDSLRDRLDELFELAVRAENGDVGIAAERLRQLQDALSEALANNAPADEIDRIIEALREAMQHYRQSLQERFANDDMQASQQDGPVEMLDLSRLDALMQALEEALRSGDRASAQEAMRQIEDMMNALANARPMPSSPPSESDQVLSEAMRALQDMMGEQQRLMDETFQNTPESQRNETERDLYQQPGTPSRRQGSENTQGLAQQQEGLRQRLEELNDALRQQGVDPGSLPQAGEAMNRAGEALQEGAPSDALEDQSDALEAMREGLANLESQMGQGQGQGDGESARQENGTGSWRQQPGEATGGTDPLGRPQQARGPDDGETRVPDTIDAERARQVLEEIRRRLAQSGRPDAELRYLERLLERYR